MWVIPLKLPRLITIPTNLKGLLTILPKMGTLMCAQPIESQPLGNRNAKDRKGSFPPGLFPSQMLMAAQLTLVAGKPGAPKNGWISSEAQRKPLALEKEPNVGLSALHRPPVFA